MEEKKYSCTLNISAERTSQNKDSYQNPSVGEDQGTRVESPILNANNMRHSSGSSSPQLISDRKPASGLKHTKSAKIINISTKVPKEHFRKARLNIKLKKIKTRKASKPSLNRNRMKKRNIAGLSKHPQITDLRNETVEDAPTNPHGYQVGSISPVNAHPPKTQRLENCPNKVTKLEPNLNLESPKYEKVLFFKRPITRDRPSPYEPQRNFKILKDFFQVKILENNSPDYAPANGGNFMFNSNLAKASSQPTEFFQAAKNQDLLLFAKSDANEAFPRVKTSIGGYRSTSPGTVTEKVILRRPKPVSRHNKNPLSSFHH